MKPPNDNGTVWYFGYGSNIRMASMRKRQIAPLEIRAVMVPSHTLTFDIFGVPCVEPAFASISAFVDLAKDGGVIDHTKSPAYRARPPVHGVAYLLTRPDYRRLVLSEGSGIAYDEICVEAIPLLPTETTNMTIHGVITTPATIAGFMVFTLRAKFPFRPNRTPSRRYMELLLQGAADNGLPEAYIQYLRSLPTFSAGTSRGHILGTALFRATFGRAVRVLAWSTKLAADDHGHCPQWVGLAVVWFYWFMWMWHDQVHARIWGRGDGGTMSYEQLKK